jgi:hypothetical protein
LDRKLILAICRARRLGFPVSISKIGEMALELMPPGTKLKATRPYVHRIMAEFDLAGPYTPHLRGPGWFPDEEHLASDSSEDLAKDVLFATDDILDYLADVRAKRILMELRGLGQLHLVDTDIKTAVNVASASASSRGVDSADNVVCNDESRWKSGSCSRKTIDVEKTRRAYVLTNVSTSFPGITVLLSMSGSSEKLGVNFVLAAERLPKITIPTREELVRSLSCCQTRLRSCAGARQGS